MGRLIDSSLGRLIDSSLSLDQAAQQIIDRVELLLFPFGARVRRHPVLGPFAFSIDAFSIDVCHHRDCGVAFSNMISERELWVNGHNPAWIAREAERIATNFVTRVVHLAGKDLSGRINIAMAARRRQAASVPPEWVADMPPLESICKLAVPPADVASLVGDTLDRFGPAKLSDMLPGQQADEPIKVPRSEVTP